MVENQRVPLAMRSSSARMPTLSGGCDHDSESMAFSNSRTHWMSSYQSAAPEFSPPSRNEPKGRWYEQADKVFRFFGYIVDQVEPTTRQEPAHVRLVIIHYYPQDSTLEMLESKETACPGVSRSIALRRPSRVSLADIRVGFSVLINGTRVQVYDADGFTRRSIPGLKPPERPPAVDKTFSITPRRAPPPTMQDPAATSASCHSPGRLHGFGGGTRSSSTVGAWLPWEGGGTSVNSEDPPGFLRMYIRWDENGSDGAGPTVHRYILHFFLEDGTVEMRELADIKGGHYFEGRFPVMIRRQKLFKGGGSPSLSVDRIGGDRASTSGATPRSARLNGTGTSGSVGSMSFGGGGGVANDLDDDVGQPLTPLDLTVGKRVLLMKRPMTVSGWDETAHVWWERLTGTNMRALQGDLEDFQRCVRSSQTPPRPPTKPKSSFYEGPPQRSGTVRERFFKASDNSGKTLRFLARATQDTKTTSTRDNVFIIRFYPEDDSLSVYTTHNLGSNAGGLYKGVYLARTYDMVNKDTGKPFKARDFYVGSVAKLPSVSLEIVDVDDFSRRYLARETPPSDGQWQTAPIWSKLLSLATSGGTGAGAWEEGVAPTVTAGGGNEDSVLPCSPRKSVTFNGGDGSGGGTAACFPSDSGAFEGFSPDNDSAFDTLSATGQDPQTADHQRDGGSGPRSSVVFARLWAECIGDSTCAAFASDDSGPILEGADGNTCTHGGPELPSPRQQRTPSSLSNPRNLDPWERLVAVLRDERRVDVSRALTAHEQILLEREVADWLQRAQGRKGRAQGPGKGMSQRLASAAAAALRQGQPAPAAVPERPPESRAGEPAAAATAAHEEFRSSGGIPNVGRRRVPAGGFEFPAVVVEGSSSPVGGSPETSSERTGSRGPPETVGDEASGGAGEGAATSGSKKKPERQLDLRGVALHAHEVPASGRDDTFVRCALARVRAHVFGHSGEAEVLRTLKAEGKTPGDVADLWTTCRLLKIVAELSRRETEGLWLKFMPAAVASAGEGGRVTFAGFLESIRAFEACLRRGEVLGLSSTGRNDNCAGPLAERSERKHTQRRV